MASTTKVAYDALVARGPGVVSKPLPGVGRFDTYTPPDGGERFYRVVVDTGMISRVVGYKLSVYQLRKRARKAEGNIRNALANLPEECRGRTFYGVETSEALLVSLPVLCHTVLFGGDIGVTAQILSNLVDETPEALDGEEVAGSLNFLAQASSTLDATVFDADGMFDIEWVWKLREEAYTTAGIKS